MRWLQRVSVTGRIAIGSLIVAALFGLVAVFVVRIGVSSILHNASVSLLTSDVAPYVNSLQQNPTGNLDVPVGGQAIAVIAPNGFVLETTLSRSLDGQIDKLGHLGPTAVDVTSGGESYLVLTSSVPTKAGTFKVIAARNQETTNLILDRLTGALLVGAGALVLGFGGASWLLARTALRPVSRMRAQAEAIVGVSSRGLLQVGPARDELGALATTLNGLILRLRASADREKQMVSDASHELRTPLAVLRGQLELAEINAGDADALLADVRASHATALRLGSLANNLLELSRIDAGAAHGRATWRELTVELAESIDRARTLAAAADSELDDEGEHPLSIDFDYSPRDRQGPTIALSPTEFGRILDNLLGNAISALGGSGVIGVEMTGNAAGVRLTVRDNGPGMPVNFLPTALDRFTRAEGARADRPGGGLGLAIVAALVGSARGTITLENAETGGLRATVVIPLLTDAVAAKGESGVSGVSSESVGTP